MVYFKHERAVTIPSPSVERRKNILNLSCPIPRRDPMKKRAKKDCSDDEVAQYCLDYLSSKNAWETEGIFRLCGNFDEVRDTLKHLRDGQPLESTLNSLGVIGVCDLLKLSLTSTTLLESCYPFLLSFPLLERGSTLTSFHLDQNEIKQKYISGIMSILEFERRMLFQGILEMFTKIGGCESNKMGLGSLCSLFSAVLFPLPLTTDPLEYAKKSEENARLLETTYTFIYSVPSFFLQYEKPPTVMYAFRDEGEEGKILFDAPAKKGDQIISFHDESNFSYIIVSDNLVYCCKNKEISSIFSLKKEAIKQTKKKRRSLRAKSLH